MRRSWIVCVLIGVVVGQIEDIVDILKVQKSLGDSIVTSLQQIGSSDNVMQAIQLLTGVDPGVQAYSVVQQNDSVELAGKSSIIFKYLQDINQQIQKLESEMDSHLQQVLNSGETVECYNHYVEAKNILVEASENLQAIYEQQDAQEAEQQKKIFLDGCANARCENAALSLFRAINEDPNVVQCDIPKILYEHNPAENSVQGWRDEVVSRSAYLLMLANQGIIIISTYYHSKSDQSPSINHQIQQFYLRILTNSIKHIKYYDKKCLNDYLKNADKAVKKYVEKNSGQSNSDLSKNLINLLTKHFPYHLWQVSVSDSSNTEYDLYVQCYQCVIHKDLYGYSIIFAALDFEIEPNLNLLNNTVIQYEVLYIGAMYDRAVDVYDQVVEIGCFYGVQVVRHDENINIWFDFFDGLSFYIFSDNFAIAAWGFQNSSCVDFSQINDGDFVEQQLYDDYEK